MKGCSRRTQPVVNPEVGNDIEQHHVPRANDSAEVVHNGAHDQQTEVGIGNKNPLRRREESAGWVVVACKCDFALILGSALNTSGDIEEEVQLPSHQLVANELNEGNNWSLLSKVLQLLDLQVLLGGQVLIGPRDKDSVLLHVASVAVVASMGDLP